MALDGADKVFDPRSELKRIQALELGGYLRDSAGPWVNGIGETLPLSKRLQRIPNVFNPLPSLKSTAPTVKRAAKNTRAVARQGAKKLRGRGHMHAAGKGALKAAKGEMKRKVAHVKRHIHEV